LRYVLSFSLSFPPLNATTNSHTYIMRCPPPGDPSSLPTTLSPSLGAPLGPNPPPPGVRAPGRVRMIRSISWPLEPPPPGTPSCGSPASPARPASRRGPTPGKSPTRRVIVFGRGIIHIPLAQYLIISHNFCRIFGPARSLKLPSPRKSHGVTVLFKKSPGELCGSQLRFGGSPRPSLCFASSLGLDGLPYNLLPGSDVTPIDLQD